MARKRPTTAEDVHALLEALDDEQRKRFYNRLLTDPTNPVHRLMMHLAEMARRAGEKKEPADFVDWVLDNSKGKSRDFVLQVHETGFAKGRHSRTPGPRSDQRNEFVHAQRGVGTTDWCRLLELCRAHDGTWPRQSPPSASSSSSAR
jgi:hypothetical protein